MKQRITIEQLNELTEEQKEKLRKWGAVRYGIVFSDYELNFIYNSESDVFMVMFQGNYYPLLSIGQMIELLQENIKDFWIRYFDKHVDFTVTVGWDLNKPKDTHTDDELCDALWQAVKEVL